MDVLASPGADTLLKRMRGKRIMVVGDVMIDEWIWGAVTRISPEAPVPVVAVRDHSFTLGGAGNVANNLRALDANVTVVCAVGTDSFAQQVRDLFAAEQVATDGVFSVDDRPTSRKTRIVAHNQQVVRADWEATAALRPDDRARLQGYIRAHAADCDAIIFSDYAKGLLSPDIVDSAKACPLLLADPKPQNLDLFAGITCVAPNVLEVAAATGTTIDSEASLSIAAQELLRRLNVRYVVITRGEHGMSLFTREGWNLHFESVAHTVYDVSGAGDTVIAVLSLALAAGAEIEQAVQLANFAAGAVVAKLGTATASADEIVALVSHDG